MLLHTDRFGLIRFQFLFTLVAPFGLVVELFELKGTLRGVVLLQASMPTAVFNYLFASQYNRNPEVVAGTVLISTLLSFAMLPFLLDYAMTRAQLVPSQSAYVSVCLQQKYNCRQTEKKVATPISTVDWLISDITQHTKVAWTILFFISLMSHKIGFIHPTSCINIITDFPCLTWT